MPLHRVQKLGQIGKVLPQSVGPIIKNALAAREDAPGLVEFIQAAGGGVEAAGHGIQRVQQRIKASGELIVVVLKVILALGELGNLLQLAQRGGDQHERQSAEGEILAADPDGVVALLAGQADEQHSSQIADELHLCTGGLKGENIVLIENGHGLQRVVVPGVLDSVRVGNGVQIDFHNAGFSGQFLGAGGNAVELVADSQRPRQRLKGTGGLTLKIEMRGRRAGVKAEGGHAASGGGNGPVRQVQHLVILAVVR